MTWKPTEEEATPPAIRENLEQLARRLGAPSVTVSERLFGDWKGLVGSPVGDFTTPLSLSKGVLVVATSEPAWARQLAFLEVELMKNLNSQLGADTVTRISVRIQRT